MLPWPGLGPTYVRAVSVLANAAIGGTNPSVTLRFTVPAAATPPKPAWQLDVYAEDSTTGKFVQTAMDLRRSSYIACAVFAALVLGGPLGWPRRAGLLGAGLAVLQALPLLPLLSFFSGKLPVQVFHFGSVTRAAIEIAYHTLVAPPGMAYAVPTLLWLVSLWLLSPTFPTAANFPGRGRGHGPARSSR